MKPSVFDEASNIPLGFLAKRQECFCLGRDEKAFVLNCPEERLDSVSISRCDEQLSPCIVKAKGKLAP